MSKPLKKHKKHQKHHYEGYREHGRWLHNAADGKSMKRNPPQFDDRAYAVIELIEKLH